MTPGLERPIGSENSGMAYVGIDLGTSIQCGGVFESAGGPDHDPECGGRTDDAVGGALRKRWGSGGGAQGASGGTGGAGTGGGLWSD